MCIRDRLRGYIAMLAVETEYRRMGISKKLVQMTLDRMREQHVDECVLETEAVNEPALRLYESFGFIRDKMLPCYYLNGNDAYRLKLKLSPKQIINTMIFSCLLYTSPSPRDLSTSRMPSSA
eukprot:TRINITY_DN1594_c0_g1_i4.p3 TRINITY_DN1594_c0_g1~~TRINITY_DN1594_c0_g1_i4.p3  ORF type:complete len:122 (+),score=48.16 TRINITY_DN1594_c0_g1_i4:58-423(+)